MTPSPEIEIPQPSPDKRLDILNDHYKDTFTRLREHEQARDRLFLWVIGVFALLILEIGYPAAVGGSLPKIALPGAAEINLQALPLPALLHATWVLALVIELQYCQATVRVNRQYPYVHDLEKTISPSLGGGDLYRREGLVYLRDYPLLLNVAWIAYGFIFPAITAVAAASLAIWEWVQLPYAMIHRIIDVLLAAALIFVLFSYLVWPAIMRVQRRW
jgi:hypothetical protein